jgi:hypothetical protein
MPDMPAGMQSTARGYHEHPNRRPTMTRIMFVAAAFASLTFAPQPAAAAEFPWCAVTSSGDGDMHWDCQYRSIEDCRPNVISGNRGWCNQNPYYVAAPADQRRSRR